MLLSSVLSTLEIYVLFLITVPSLGIEGSVRGKGNFSENRARRNMSSEKLIKQLDERRKQDLFPEQAIVSALKWKAPVTAAKSTSA